MHSSQLTQGQSNREQPQGQRPSDTSSSSLQSSSLGNHIFLVHELDEYDRRGDARPVSEERNPRHLFDWGLAPRPAGVLGITNFQDKDSLLVVGMKTEVVIASCELLLSFQALYEAHLDFLGDPSPTGQNTFQALKKAVTAYDGRRLVLMSFHDRTGAVYFEMRPSDYLQQLNLAQSQSKKEVIRTMFGP